MSEYVSAFPYFGGKSKAAELIWSRLGSDCGNYVEPFFGSGAVWVKRPPEYNGWATANDKSGHVSNFWRSVQKFPELVAESADWIVHECDLHARHLWLVKNHNRLSERLMADVEYCEPETAGWWAWGACSWIGSGWCGSGSWGAVEDDEGILTFKKIAHLGDGGQGVNRQIPHLGDGGKGVNRQIPHLGNGGKGVNRKSSGDKRSFICSIMDGLKEQLRDIRVASGDWERVCSVGTMTRNGVCAVVFDPPYSQTKAVYAEDSKSVSGLVREWCVKHGNNDQLRIALCGHDGEHNELEDLGWEVMTWDKAGGYQGSDDRERIWFSPHCLKPEELREFEQLSLF